MLPHKQNTRKLINEGVNEKELGDSSLATGLGSGDKLRKLGSGDKLRKLGSGDTQVFND